MTPGERPSTSWLDQYREPAARLIGEAVGSTFAWQRLAVLTDSIGHRLSGTPALDRAIAWAVDEMKRDGLENVHTESVMVPKWVRGAESAEIVEPARHAMVMLGLGDSVGTGPGAEGVQAEVVVVHSFEELEAKADRARGRIVLFNVPFTSYGETVRYRAQGPSRAARHGAVAVLVRAVGPPGLRTPHTGALQYAADVPKIPAAAITTEDADRLQRMADRGSRIVVRLKMDAHFEADADVRQRHRRAARPREARRNRRRRRASRLVGRRRRRDRRWRRLHRDVGSAADHEEAEPAAAAHGARGAVHQRRERRPRRARLSRPASRRARRTTS